MSSEADKVLANMASTPYGGEGLGISIKYPVEEYGVVGEEGTVTASVTWQEMNDLGFDRPGDGPGIVDEETGEWRPFYFFGLRVGGDVVAVWDEGRWWTPEESNAYLATLTSPLMRQMAEATAMNREQRRKR